MAQPRNRTPAVALDCFRFCDFLIPKTQATSQHKSKFAIADETKTYKNNAAQRQAQDIECARAGAVSIKFKQQSINNADGCIVSNKACYKSKSKVNDLRGFQMCFPLQYAEPPGLSHALV